MLSMARSRRNAHLWDVYAAGGSGVCLGFDLSWVVVRSEVDWAPLPVIYEDSRPDLNILDYQPPATGKEHEFVRKSFASKAVRWSQEDEVRLVLEVGDRQPPKFELPHATVTSICLGPRISATDRAEILRWGRGSARVFETLQDGEGFAFQEVE